MATQSITSDAPAQSAGSILVLQALVAQLIVRHPDRDRIMASVALMSDGVKASASGHTDDGARKDLNDLAKGMDDTVATIREYLDVIDIDADAGFTSSTTGD